MPADDRRAEPAPSSRQVGVMAAGGGRYTRQWNWAPWPFSAGDLTLGRRLACSPPTHPQHVVQLRSFPHLGAGARGWCASGYHCAMDRHFCAHCASLSTCMRLNFLGAWCS
eukprot:scaffold140920_cov30-Tisochrysis_lutea.AAC.4